MKFKKMLSLMAATAIAAGSLAAIAITADAASVDDAKTITADMTYWFDDANANGTTKIEADTVFGEYFYTPSGHNAATNKGKTTVDGVNHFNSLRVKSATQDRFAFKVGGAATITFYTQSHTSRGVVITKDDYTTALASQTYATTTFEYKIDSAQTVYVTANGDFFLAGVSVDITNDAPTEPTTAPADATEAPADPTEAPADATEAPAEPDTLIPVNEAKTWTQADFEIGAYTATVLSSDKTLAINGADNKAINVDKNAIKLGGTGSAAERNVSFIPAADGVVKVTAVNGNISATDRCFAIENAGTITESDKIDKDQTVELAVVVKANEPVYIYSKKSGVNLISIAYTVGVPALEITTTVDPEKASAFTKADGYDKDMVVGIVELSVENGFIDLNSASYEGNAPTEVAGDNAANFSGTALVTIVINGATSTEALEHVIFN